MKNRIVKSLQELVANALDKKEGAKLKGGTDDIGTQDVVDI